MSSAATPGGRSVDRRKGVTTSGVRASCVLTPGCCPLQRGVRRAGHQCLRELSASRRSGPADAAANQILSGIRADRDTEFWNSLASDSDGLASTARYHEVKSHEPAGALLLLSCSESGA